MLEISDIITLPPVMVVYALVLGAIAIYMNYRWVKFSPVIFLITLVLASGGVDTVHNEVIGPMVIREQGQSYVYFAYAEILVVLFANIAGVYFGIKRNKKLHNQLFNLDGEKGPPPG